jgi:hypothetical protein
MNEIEIKSIFEQCAQKAETPFWSEIFNDCAQDKYPKGVKRRSEILYIKPVNKLPILINLSNKDVDAIYTRIYEAFSDVLHITCNDDNTQRTEDFDTKIIEKETKLKERSWTNVKKDNERKYYLQQFINLLVEQNKAQLKAKVTPKIYMNLYRELVFAMSVKDIVSEQIHFDDGKITSIDNVKFDPATVGLVIEPYVEKKKNQRRKVVEEEEEQEVCVEQTKIHVQSIWDRICKNTEARRKSYCLKK